LKVYAFRILRLRVAYLAECNSRKNTFMFELNMDRDLACGTVGHNLQASTSR